MSQLKKHKVLIKSVINKEKNIKDVCDKVGITLKDESPLNISYMIEIFTLMGLPKEGEIVGFSWDDYITDYVGIIWGDKNFEEVFKSWEKKLKKIEVPYDPKQHKGMLQEYVKKEKVLFQALKVLGLGSSSPFSELISDWELAKALFSQTSSEFSQDLFSVIEKSEKESDLYRKWV